MAAPAELGRLQALGDEAFDRPGVDETVERLRILRPLGVAFGDVDALDAETLHQFAPGQAIAGIARLHLHVGGEVEERLLHEPRHHAGVGAAAGNRRRTGAELALERQHPLAQRVVGAGGIVELGIVVEAGPGLHHRIDVEGARLAGEPHDVG